MNLKYLIFFTASVLATASSSFVDIHETGVGLKHISHSENHDVFAITIKRVDDLMDAQTDGNVKEVGLRLSQAILTFDVNSETGALSCNSQPVAYGLSMVNVEADVTTAFKKDALKTMTEEQIKAAFDKGIVSIKVSAEGQKVSLPNGLTIQKIVIKEQIAEVNGEKVTESEVVQQVIEIYPGGKVQKGKPTISTDNAMEDFIASPTSNRNRMGSNANSNKIKAHAKKIKDHKSLIAKTQDCAQEIASWFHAQSPFVKFASVLFLGSVLGFISIALLHIFTLVFLGTGLIKRCQRSRGQQMDGEKGMFIEKVNLSEKSFAQTSGEDELLPGYQTRNYAPLSTDDL